MKPASAIVILLLLSTVASGAGAGDFAAHARVATPDYEVDAIDVLESLPPRFELVLARDMPTPGWAIAVEDVAIDRDRNRIEVLLTEQPPTGMVAQVITPIVARVDIPAPIPPGRYVVTVRSRRGAEGEFRPVLAFVLVAVP